MGNQNEIYAAPESDLQQESTAEKKGWKLLAVWTTILIVINFCLSFVVAASQAEFNSLDILFSYVVGNVFGLPVIVLLLSQIWKKHRNGRSRIKAVLYPSYLVLFSQGASIVSFVSEVANKSA